MTSDRNSEKQNSENQIPEKLQIRRAAQKDIEALAAASQLMARETEGRELDLDKMRAGVVSFVNNPQLGFYLIGETRGVVAGSLMITYEWSDWNCGLYWWIQSVYVAKEFRGRGVYRSLYEFVKEDAQRSTPHVCGIRLYVDLNNKIAQQTYERVGMQDSHYKMYEEMF